MLHTKFRGNRSNGPGEEDILKVSFNLYVHGGHLGHEVSIMSLIFISLNLKAYI